MGLLLKIKCVDSRLNVHILASESVPFILKTVQVPNLALTHTKQITVFLSVLVVYNPPHIIFLRTGLVQIILILYFFLFFEPVLLVTLRQAMKILDKILRFLKIFIRF